MSILIKGVDLPEAYTSAWLTVFECVGEHTFMKTHKVSAEQIQAIPPHGRLIDADVLNTDDMIESWVNGDLYRHEWCIDEWINNAPTIIEAEEGK